MTVSDERLNRPLLQSSLGLDHLVWRAAEARGGERGGQNIIIT